MLAGGGAVHPDRRPTPRRLAAATLQRDERGFLLTGRGLLRDGRPPRAWPLDRSPLLLETSLPGVFAAGDVRHGSVKRVASSTTTLTTRHRPPVDIPWNATPFATNPAIQLGYAPLAHQLVGFSGV